MLRIAPIFPITSVVGITIATQQLKAYGGIEPYTFSVSPSLPSGLDLSASGLLSGTAETLISGNYTVTVTDSTAATATAEMLVETYGYVAPVPPYIEVSDITLGVFIGLAELVSDSNNYLFGLELALLISEMFPLNVGATPGAFIISAFTFSPIYGGLYSYFYIDSSQFGTFLNLGNKPGIQISTFPSSLSTGLKPGFLLQ